MITPTRIWRRILKWLVPVLVLFAVVAGGICWLLVTESGLRWLVSVAESQSAGKLNITGISRTLIHPLKAELVQFSTSTYKITLRDVRFDWQPSALLSGKLRVFSVRVHDAEVILLPSSEPKTYPDNLHIPLDLNVLQLKLDRLAIYSREGTTADFSATDIEARLINDKYRLELQEFQARSVYGTVTGSGSIGLEQPYVIDAKAALQSKLNFDGKSEPTTVHAHANGNLKDLNIQFDGNVADIEMDGTSQFLPYATVPLTHLNISFSGANPARLYKDAPAADLSGRIDLRGVSNNELEGSLLLHNKSAAPWDKGGLPIPEISSRITLSTTDIHLSQLVATLADAGTISGAVSWQSQDNQLSGALKIVGVTASALHTKLPATRFGGEIKVDGKRNELRAEVALGDGSIDIHMVAEQHDMQLDLSDVRIRRGKTVFTGQGQLMMDQLKGFTAAGQLQHLDLSEFATVPTSDINAVTQAHGNLGPELTADVQVDFNDRKLLQHELVGTGRIQFAGGQSANAEVTITVLENRFSMKLVHDKDADKLDLKMDAPSLAQFGYGLEGQVSGQAKLAGSLQSPLLEFDLRGTDLVMPGGYHISEFNTSGGLRTETVSVNLNMKGVSGPGELNIPAAAIGISGSMAHQDIQASVSLAQGKEPVGDLTLHAGGSVLSSDVAWKDRKWRGSLDKFEARGLLPFSLREPAPLVMSSQAVYLGDSNFDFKLGHARLDDLLWTPRMIHSAGNFTGLNVRIVNQKQLEQLTDQLRTMRFGGSWDITSSEHLNGYLRLQHENGDPKVLANSDNRLDIHEMHLVFRAEGDQLHGELVIDGEVPGHLTADANIPIAQTGSGWSILPDAPLSGRIKLKSANLSWVGEMLDKNLTSSGAIELDAGLEGTFSVPRLRGEIHGSGLAVGLLDQGIGLEQGELHARFEGNSVRLDQLEFRAPYAASPRDKLFADYTLAAGVGKLSASGTIDLDGDNSELLITAQHLPLTQRSDRWIIASGKGYARYAGKALRLDGNVRADAGLINQPVSDRPRLPDDVQLVGEASASKSQMPYSVVGTLDMGDHFLIRASGLESRLAGNLDVRKEMDEPLSVTGIIAARDAVFEAYGQRLQVERGMVNFQGKLDDPGLNILALRKGLSVEAGVEVTGTVRRPVVRLVSTPNVPDGEKLSWIMLGRVPESSGVDNSLLVAAASNILGGQTAGQFSRALGVDEISLSQQTGTDSIQSQKVTVAKRLSTRASISYEKGLTETGGVTKFTYTLTPRITIVTRSGTEDALDLFYSFRFY
ncbi:MAG: translocation/assembly module TamB domain-containing protein [Gallionella sp.]